jgi:branched-chain amino acid transport system permease protein
VPVAFVLLWGIGWVLYYLVVRKVITRDLFTSLLATFGLAICIQQTLNLVFGPDAQSAQAGLPTWQFAGGLISVAATRLIAFALAVALAIGVVLFMKNSRMGQAIRATAQDARAARVLGIEPERVYAFTFSLNAAICGAAGALVAMVWNIPPFYGTTYSIRMFVIVTAAGVGNLPGVIAAGFGMGVFEQFGGFLFGAEFQQALIVILLLGVLTFRILQQRRFRQAVQ